MGLIIIAVNIVSYIVGSRYLSDPEMVALLAVTITAVLFILAFLIVRNFERLAEVSRMKSEFVSIASHQLRTPISNLKWALDFLSSHQPDVQDEKRSEYMDILHENTERMHELVSDLLTVSRIETATLVFKKDEISLAALAEAAVSAGKVLAQARNVSLKFSSEPNLPLVMADPSQLRLVMENFIDNAVRYAKASGEVGISVGKAGNAVVFEVRDDGLGIPKEDQKFIFQKFFRASNIKELQFQGSGLGLYIAKAIVEKSGGKIGFESQENKGSRFWFSLPIK